MPSRRTTAPAATPGSCGAATPRWRRCGPCPCPPTPWSCASPDRWSLAVFSQRAFSALTPEERGARAHRFYNDTYQMDQNACSSPQLVLWLDGGPACRGRWWEAVAAEAAERYPRPLPGGPQAGAAVPLRHDHGGARRRRRGALSKGNLLYVARLAGLSETCPWPGGFGLFFEADLPRLEALAPCSRPRRRPWCAGAGAGGGGCPPGPGRGRGRGSVVPLGQALEMDTVWDGRDPIAALSRIIG